MDKDELEICALKQSLKATPQDHPTRVACLTKLVNLLSRQSDHLGKSPVEVIRYIQEAVELTSGDPVAQRPFLSILAGRLFHRYMKMRAMADLDSAIEILRAVIRTMPGNQAERSSSLSNLDVYLRIRYERTKDQKDLEDSVTAGTAAIHTAPASSRYLARAFNNLLGGLHEHRSIPEVVSELNKTIETTRNALSVAMTDYPQKAWLCHDLKMLHKTRYYQTRDLIDLEEAIRLGGEEFRLTPSQYPMKSSLLHFVADSLDTKYGATGDIVSMRKAFQLRRVDLKKNPSKAFLEETCLQGLSASLEYRYFATGAVIDMRESLALSARLLGVRQASTLSRIQHGRRMMRGYVMLQEWQRAYQVARFMLQLIPSLILHSHENADKQYLLRELIGLGSNAAAVALHTGKDASTALEILELGRGVIAESLQQMRTDILDLQRQHPKLAQHFRELRRALQARNDRFSIKSNPASWPSGTNIHHEIGMEMDQLIRRIRNQTGFEDFLSAPSEADMLDCARGGYIVVLNISIFRCDALVVQEKQIRSIPLSKVRYEDIQAKREQEGQASLVLLEWLWDHIISPIMDALELTQAVLEGQWPHIWWIPTGSLSGLPIHAAGYQRAGNAETVLDRAMSSYTSSIKALIHGRRRHRPPLSPGKMVLVAMEKTPQYTRLPFVDEEISMLHRLGRTMIIDPVEPPPFKQQVVSGLLDCSVFHFAGHCYTDIHDPSNSQLLLNDWETDPFRVADLLKMDLSARPPFLAYLSACGTGRIRDEKLYDESIHLISAYQLAGCRHVIGTLWEVNDATCVDMARITYEGMRDGGMTDESVCLALHNASRQLRSRWLGECGGMIPDPEDTSVMSQCSTRESMVSNVCSRDAQPPRDIELEDDEVVCTTNWVPYVHFGL